MTTTMILKDFVPGRNEAAGGGGMLDVIFRGKGSLVAGFNGKEALCAGNVRNLWKIKLFAKKILKWQKTGLGHGSYCRFFLKSDDKKSGMEMLGEIPGSAVWQRIFWNRRLPVSEKETGRIPKLYYRVGELIVKSDVADVPFLMELARTLEVLNRLATNEKVLYIANLFKHTFCWQGTETLTCMRRI